ncbi:MAG: FGGY family carbohydrate kinase [Selenomonadaceae bacterium]
MENYYLSFDAGTQSVKVTVYNAAMECVAKSSNKTTLSYPQPGWVNMNADEYLSLAKQGMKECSEQLRQKHIDLHAVKAIMGDGIICGIVGIDAQAHAITPYINYLDSRTEADAVVLKEQNLTVWGEETGNPEPRCMFPAMHARWLLTHHEGFQQHGTKFVHNAPYILMNLAGLASSDAFIDWGTLSGWGLGYNIMQKKWSDTQLTILGIDKNYLPHIVKPWDIIGTLSTASAAETGFPAGIPICAGAGDTMQSMLGSGITAPGKAVDVAGTCAMFCVSTSGIIPALSQKGSGLIFNSGTLPDTYFYWGFVRTGGLALRWFKDNICQKPEDDRYYTALSKKAAAIAPGCKGVLFLPYLTGGYGTYADIRASFMNMTMDTDQFILWRAVLEAIAYDYLEVTDTYRRAGIRIDRITITEGGSKDDLWNQIKADVIGSETSTLHDAGGALLTNAVLAAYAAGNIKDLRHQLLQHQTPAKTYTPDKTNTKIYRQQYSRQKEILHKLSGK